MPRRRKSTSPLTPEAVMLERLNDLDKTIALLRGAKVSTLLVADKDNFNEPAEGMSIVNWPTAQFCFYHNGEWICMPLACHAIKVYTDRKLTKVENGAFRFPIEPDLHDHDIVMTKAFVGDTGNTTSLTIANHTRGDLVVLSSPLTIPGGGLVSGPAATTLTTIIDTPVAGRRTNNVHEDDMMWINVLSGSTTKGLGLYIYFNRPLVDNTI